MQKKKVIIGLDIGVNSVGWCMLDSESNKIIDRGVRLFDSSQDSDGNSKRKIRGEFRRKRRTIRREKMRLISFKNAILNQYFTDNRQFNKLFDNISKDELDNLLHRPKQWNISLENILPYDKFPTMLHIRKFCLENKNVDKKILLVVLYYFLSHRGSTFIKPDEYEKKIIALNEIKNNELFMEYSTNLKDMINNNLSKDELLKFTQKFILDKAVLINQNKYMMKIIKSTEKPESEFLIKKSSRFIKNEKLYSNEIYAADYLLDVWNNNIDHISGNIGSYKNSDETIDITINDTWKEIDKILDNNKLNLNDFFIEWYKGLFWSIKNPFEGPWNPNGSKNLLNSKNNYNCEWSIYKDKFNKRDEIEFIWEKQISPCKICGSNKDIKKEKRISKMHPLNEIGIFLSTLNNLKINDENLTFNEKIKIIKEFIITDFKRNMCDEEKIAKILNIDIKNISNTPTFNLKSNDDSKNESNFPKIIFTRKLYKMGILKKLGITEIDELWNNDLLSEINNKIQFIILFLKNLIGINKNFIKENFKYNGEDFYSLFINDDENLTLENINDLKNTISKSTMSQYCIVHLKEFIRDNIINNGKPLNVYFKNQLNSYYNSIFKIDPNKKYLSPNAMECEDISSLDFSENNKRPFRESIKVLNQILKIYIYDNNYIIDSIIIELSNEEKNRKLKDFYIQKNKDNRDLWNSISKRHPSLSDTIIEKLFLLHKQDYKDLFTLERIDEEDIIKNNLDYNIDHILPQHKYQDNSISSKIILKASNNQKVKGIKLFSEILSNNEFEKNKQEWIRIFKDNDATKDEEKLSRLLMSREEADKRFINRNLVDTRISTRYIFEYLKIWIKNTNSVKQYIDDSSRVIAINGQITAKIRGYINKSINDNLKPDRIHNKHHALDASIICFYANHYSSNVIGCKNYLNIFERYDFQKLILNKFISKDSGEIIPWEELVKMSDLCDYQNIKYSYRVNKNDKKINMPFFAQNPIKVNLSSDKYEKISRINLLELPQSQDKPVDKMKKFIDKINKILSAEIVLLERNKSEENKFATTYDKDLITELRNIINNDLYTDTSYKLTNFEMYRREYNIKNNLPNNIGENRFIILNINNKIFKIGSLRYREKINSFFAKKDKTQYFTGIAKDSTYSFIYYDDKNLCLDTYTIKNVDYIKDIKDVMKIFSGTLLVKKTNINDEENVTYGFSLNKFLINNDDLFKICSFGDIDTRHKNQIYIENLNLVGDKIANEKNFKKEKIERAISSICKDYFLLDVDPLGNISLSKINKFINKNPS